MSRRTKILGGVAGFGVLLILLGELRGTGKHAAEPPAPTSAHRGVPGLRVTMAALHRQGGVPIGWQFTPPPGDVAAGRKTFVDFGCPSCHRVAGESFSVDAGAHALGPDLTGMGSHHPPGYFAEAIVNPDAVLIDEPGYIGPDGHSIMPSYPEMTISQLSDLVAYLASLTQGGSGQNMPMPASASMTGVPPDSADLPARPEQAAKSFFAQTYEILPGKRVAFETWFKAEGVGRFLAADGLLNVETYVDTAGASPTLTSIFGFRDETALRNFMSDPGNEDLWKQFDGFIGPHDHRILPLSPIYRAASLSTGREVETRSPSSS